jgi:hypothetical protein
LQISDRDKKRSRRSRSRSRSPRRRSRSRDRARDKNRDFKNRKNVPTLETAPPSTSGGEYLLQHIFNILLCLNFVVDKDRSLSPPLVKSPEAIQLSAGIVPGFTNNPTLARIQDQLQKRRALWSNKVSGNQLFAFLFTYEIIKFFYSLQLLKKLLLPPAIIGKALTYRKMVMGK